VTDPKDRERVHTLVMGLVEMRKAQKLTVTDVALKAHWSPTTVRRFETGRTDPTLTQVMAYVRATGGRAVFEIAEREDDA
jgi:transcriptional regulator with XRE-family HTH domain